MNIGFKTSLAMALALSFSSVASAQENPNLKLHASLSYSNDKGTWNTVFIVSAVVLVVGLIQSDSTLAILGGAGVLVSLSQQNKLGFAPNYAPHGIDFMRRGPLAFGMNPFGSLGLRQGFNDVRPSFYVAANFKF